MCDGWLACVCAGLTACAPNKHIGFRWTPVHVCVCVRASSCVFLCPGVPRHSPQRGRPVHVHVSVYASVCVWVCVRVCVCVHVCVCVCVHVCARVCTCAPNTLCAQHIGSVSLGSGPRYRQATTFSRPRGGPPRQRCARCPRRPTTASRAAMPSAISMYVYHEQLCMYVYVDVRIR